MNNKSNPTSPRNSGLSTAPILPEHFAEQVLDFETEMDLDCNIGTVLKLMELYSSAIEHYESVSNPKYLHFQERLQNLLARKDVITLLNMGSPTSVYRQKPSEILKKMQEQVAIRQKYRAHQVGIFMSNYLPESRDVDKILTQHKSDNKIIKSKAIENLRNQESPDLENRALARKRRSGTPVAQLNRTFTFNFQEKKFKSYQEEIEDAVEKCIEEKSAKIKEIKKKYKDEIKQLKEMGHSSLIEQVIDDMKVKLKEEIGLLEKEMSEKRKKMLDEIKANYV